MTSRPTPETLLSEQLSSLIAAIVRREVSTLLASREGSRPRLLPLDAAAALLGIGRSRLYDEIGAGRIRSVKVGRRRLVPESALTDYVEKKLHSEPSE